jgi:hypothetical protein
LTGSTECGSSKLVQSVVFVSIRHDDTMVFCTQVGLDALAVLSTAFEDVFTRVVGSNKRDGLDVRVVADEVDSVDT